MVIATLGCILAISSCSTRTAATVQDRSASTRKPTAAFRDVRSGDTLYSIAWESGRDYRELAAWNGIESPYVIKVGQRIRLFPPAAEERPATETGYRVVAKGDTLYGIASALGVRYQDLAAWNGIEPPYTLAPGQRLRTAPVPAATTAKPSARSTDTKKPPDADITEGARALTWRWPAEGAIIARFAPNDATKGIDIAGTAGQPIHAAAPGKVVYQGSGLRGYGQLIIIKHNADFLSAYAHCAAIYVQEGSVIQPGQRIAAMGSTGTDRVKLHFEIRRRGIPVDPLEHLPKK